MKKPIHPPTVNSPSIAPESSWADMDAAEQFCRSNPDKAITYNGRYCCAVIWFDGVEISCAVYRSGNLNYRGRSSYMSHVVRDIQDRYGIE